VPESLPPPLAGTAVAADLPRQLALHLLVGDGGGVRLVNLDHLVHDLLELRQQAVGKGPLGDAEQFLDAGLAVLGDLLELLVEAPGDRRKGSPVSKTDKVDL